jgi:hypothetical protein
MSWFEGARDAGLRARLDEGVRGVLVRAVVAHEPA